MVFIKKAEKMIFSVLLLINNKKNCLSHNKNMRNVSIVYKKNNKKEERPHLASMGHINHHDYLSTPNPQKR